MRGITMCKEYWQCHAGVQYSNSGANDFIWASTKCSNNNGTHPLAAAYALCFVVPILPFSPWCWF